MNADEEAVNFKVILLATDGSEFSMGTERVGLDMAEQHQANLHILRLILADPGSSEAMLEEEDASQHLEKIGALCLGRNIQCTTLIRHAEEPSQGILTVAKEVEADLVVVGRRGRRGMARFMVGDATAKVVEKSECTVLVVPRLVNIWSSGILLVADPTPLDDDKAAHSAYSLALTAQLPLTIVLVADEDEKESELQESYQMVNRLVAMAKLQEITAEGLVQTGKIDEVILEVARQRAADLIVCEPRDRSLMEKLFNTNKIVHLIGHAHCPVMVVK